MTKIYQFSRCCTKASIDSDGKCIEKPAKKPPAGYKNDYIDWRYVNICSVTNTTAVADNATVKRPLPK